MDLNSSSSGCDMDEGSSNSNSPASTPRKGRGRGRGMKRRRSHSPMTPLDDPQVGDIVWAKMKQHRWWPGILVNKEDCGKLVSLGGRRTLYFVYWYGDGRVSPIAMSNLVDFRKGYQKFISPCGSPNFKSGVYLAIKEFRKFQMLDTDDYDVTRAFAWANNGFPLPKGCDIVRTHGSISQHVRDKLKTLRVKYEDEGGEHDAADSSLYLEYSSEQVDLIHSIRDGTTSLHDICLACVSEANGLQEHPLFHGSICGQCMEKFLQHYFSIGLDLVAFHCTVCLDLGDMMVCSQPYCYRAYCSKCIAMKATIGVIDIIREADPWLCFLCKPYTHEMHGLLKPRVTQRKLNMWQAFHSETLGFESLKDIPLRILCFDESCDTALAVLSIIAPLGVKIDTIFLCNYSDNEMKKFRPNLLQYVSRIETINEYDNFKALSGLIPIQIVIASPGDKDKNSFGSKFFSFHNILSMLNILNLTCIGPLVPLMWAFEVALPYWHDYIILISRYLQFDPATWSKQVRKRKSSNLVWANIPSVWSALEDANIPQTSSPLEVDEKEEELTVHMRDHGVGRECAACQGVTSVVGHHWLFGHPSCSRCCTMQCELNSGNEEKKPLRVLSMFDGIGTGLLVLEALGLEIEEYFSCEIDDAALAVLNFRFHGKIKHLGSVSNLTPHKLRSLGRIDLLLGGSPCNQLSLANPRRKGLFDPVNSGVLFFDFNRVLKFLQASAFSSGNKLLWLYENVAAMPHDFRDTISRTLQCKPAEWDAIQFLPAKRARLFWGNIPDLHRAQVSDKLPPCLDSILEPFRQALVPSLPTLTTTFHSQATGKEMQLPVMEDGNEDGLLITERERLFGFPSHFTDGPDLSIYQRQCLLGRAWSVPVIEKILLPLTKEFKLKDN